MMRVHAVGGESIAYSYRVQLPKTQCGWDPLPRSCETLRNVVRCLTFQRGPCVFRVSAQGLIRPRGGESNPVIPVWLVAGGEQRGAVGAVVAAERSSNPRPQPSGFGVRLDGSLKPHFGDMPSAINEFSPPAGSLLFMTDPELLRHGRKRRVSRPQFQSTHECRRQKMYIDPPDASTVQLTVADEGNDIGMRDH